MKTPTAHPRFASSTKIRRIAEAALPAAVLDRRRAARQLVIPNPVPTPQARRAAQNAVVGDVGEGSAVPLTFPARLEQGTAAPFSPPPCFYWKWCSQRAALNKCGRSVCRRCGDTLRGTEYPLRDPSEDRRNLLRHHAAIAAAEINPPE